MEKNTKNYYVDGSVKEVIIREGEAPKVLNPLSANISGGIRAIRQYIDVLKLDNTKDIVTYSLNPNHLYIKLVRDYQNAYGPNDMIQSNLKLNTEILTNVFGINSDKLRFEPLKLANLLKMNKRFCADRDQVEILITKLTNFKATVNKKIEKSTDNRGNKNDIFVQEVVSELPKDLKLSIPVFVGEEPSVFFVELLFDTSESSVQIYLISAELQTIIEEKAKVLINTELEYLKEKGLACIDVTA